MSPAISNASAAFLEVEGGLNEARQEFDEGTEGKNIVSEYVEPADDEAAEGETSRAGG